VRDSVPSREAFGASLLPCSVKASISSFFCRLSLIESCVLLAAPCCLGLPHSREYYARCLFCLFHIEERTKTASSKAPIPLVPILQEWLVVHRNGSSADGFIFVGEKMGRPLNLANLARRVIVPKLKENKIEWHGWHSFRRGLGTNLYRIGTPDKTIQAVLRHSNVSTTLSLYVKPVAEDSQAAMQKLEKAFKVVRKTARKASQEKARKPS
jgi:hypothetical protein